MPRKLLTDTSIKNAKLPAGRTFIYQPDLRVAGMYLRVGKLGKSFHIRTRNKAGKQVRERVGEYGEMTLKDAREKASAMIANIRAGRDPKAARLAKDRKKAKKRAKRSAKSEATFAKLVEDYLTARADDRATIGERRRRFEIDVLPLIGHVRADKVTTKDIAGVINLKKSKAPIAANRLLSALSAVFKWGIGQGKIGKNPCSPIPRPSQETGEGRDLKLHEIRIVWSAADDVGYPFGPFVKLLLLTGQRRRVVARATWNEFDLERLVWHVEFQRMKKRYAHDVMLAPQTAEFIDRLQRDYRNTQNPYLFSGLGKTGEPVPISGFSHGKRLIDAAVLSRMNGKKITAGELRKMSKEQKGQFLAELDNLKPWGFHSLRHTAATGWTDLGTDYHVVRKLLPHKDASTTGGYIHSKREDEQRDAVNAWADYVMNLTR